MRYVFLKILLLLVACQVNAQNLALAIAKLNAEPDMKAATLSLCVNDFGTGKMVYGVNEQKNLTPASTLKLFSTISALELLGKDYQFKTYLVYQPKDSSKDVSKDFIIPSCLQIYTSFDPTWNSQYFKNNNVIAEINTKIKQHNWNFDRVVVHKNIRDRKLINDNWIWADIGNYYGTPANSICIYDNKISTYFNTAEQENINVELVKTNLYVKDILINASEVVSANIKKDQTIAYSIPGNSNITITGELPLNRQYYQVEVSNPIVDSFFKQLLQEQIPAIKTVFFQTDVENLDFLYPRILSNWDSICSPLLSEIVYNTNLKSNNLYAECLLRNIGYVKNWNSKYATVIDSLLMYWKTKINFVQPDIVDGCGLSPVNKVNASMLNKLLYHATKQSYFDVLKKSFPVMGQSGSLTNMANGTIADGRVFAKTGYIHGVRAYSGYVYTVNKRKLIFTCMVNNFTCEPTRIKKLLEPIFIEMCKY